MRTYYCARLIIGPNDRLVKIELPDNGGRRKFQVKDRTTTFDEVHSILRKIYGIHCPQKSYVYDYRRHPFNFNRYGTFNDYTEKNNLSTYHTVLYLVTSERHDKFVNRIKSKQTSPSRRVTNRKRSSVINRSHGQNVPNSNEDSILPCVPDNDDIMIINDDDDDIVELIYSPKEANLDLIKNCQSLINQNSSNDVFIQLHKYFSMIFGSMNSTSSDFDEKFDLQSISEQKIRLDIVSNIFDKCQSAKNLIDLNRNQFIDVELFSTMLNSFNRFFTHIETIKNQWFEKMNHKSNRLTTTELPIPSIFNQQRIDDEKSNDCPQILPSINEQIKPSNTIFNNIIQLLKSSLNTSYALSFELIIQLSLDDIESLQTTTDLHNELSICHAKQILLDIKILFKNKSNELYSRPWLCNSEQELILFIQKTLHTLRKLFLALDHLQIQANQIHR